MTRTLALWTAILGACTVGEVPPVGGGDDDGSGGDITAACAQRNATPATAYSHTTAPTGPRAGQGGIAGGCNLTGQTGTGAGAVTSAGTVYTDINGTTAAAGVTVHLYKDTASLANAVTDDAGNFVIRTPLAGFPYKTLVSGCGPATPNDIKKMGGTIAAAAQANCNGGAGCHGVPGTNAAYIAPN